MNPSFQRYVPMVALLASLTAGRMLAAGLVPGSITASSTNSVEQAAPAHHFGDNLIWGLQWDNGLQYELGSSSRVARVTARHPEAGARPYHGKVGLKLHLDAADYGAGTGAGDIPNDDGVRRARLYATGNFFLLVPVFYKTEAELADRNFYVRETYISLAELPLMQTLKVGFFKTPMTLEGYMSAGDTIFLERASPVEAFGPGIMFGIQPAGVIADKRGTWALGCFADGGQSDVSEASRSLTRAIGRVTWLPMYDNGAEKTKLIHLGASAQYLYSRGGSVEYRSRPESYFAPRLVDTGNLDAQNALSWGVEAAAEHGPLSLQAELLQALDYRADAAPLAFYGYYVAGSWLMTGESRPYNRNSGAFGRVVPRKTFSLRDWTFGAWEVAVRFSHLDLNDEEVKGGTMDIGTLGLNAYLTSRLKVMIDYGYGSVNGGQSDGDLRILEGRVQYEL